MSAFFKLLEVAEDAWLVYTRVAWPKNLDEFVLEEKLAQSNGILPVDRAVGRLDFRNVLEDSWDVLKELLEVASGHRSKCYCEGMLVILVIKQVLRSINFIKEWFTCFLCFSFQIAVGGEQSLAVVEVERNEAPQECSEASQERFPESIFL